MFEIKDLPEPGPSGKTIAVVDESRDAYLQLLEKTWRPNRSCFVLVWKGKAIPFDAYSESEWDDNGEYIVKTIDSFGGSAFAWRHGIERCRIDDPDELNQAKMLAAEAVLACGSLYNGDKKPNGFHRINLDGRIYIKSDFGLASPAP